MDPLFLTVDEVITLNVDQCSRYGGLSGVRDKNHPFVDGNKRVGAVAARIFLMLNGIRIEMPEDEIYDLVIATAEGRATKADIAEAFERHTVTG